MPIGHAVIVSRMRIETFFGPSLRLILAGLAVLSPAACTLDEEGTLLFPPVDGGSASSGSATAGSSASSGASSSASGGTGGSGAATASSSSAGSTASSTAAGSGGAPTGCAALNPPDTPPMLCSTAGGPVVAVTFENQCSNEAVDLYWIDYQCMELHYQTLAPGQTYVLNSYLGHPWRFREQTTQKLLKDIPPIMGPGTVTVP